MGPCSSLRFIAPDKKYAASFAEALHEGLHSHAAKPEEITQVKEDFEGWLREQNDLTRPFILPDGRAVQRVPQTMLWLVNGSRFLGRVDIRHTLSETLKTYGGHIGYAVRR